MNENTYNFRLHGSSEPHFANQIDTNNLVDGKPIYYVRNTSNEGYNSSINAGTFYIINGVNITLTDLNLTTNHYGIFLWNTTDSNIQNVSVSNNNCGIYLVSSSDNNTLTSNTASNNNYGIYVISSNDNIFYDNYFNNSANVYDSYDNIWNTTKTEGTNIIGGSWLGGNYWSDYEGIDTDSDDLGDTLTPYNSSGNINGGDYHPLTMPDTTEPPAPTDDTDTSNGPVNYPTPLPENVANSEVKGTIFNEPVTSADLKFTKGYITLVTVDAKDKISEVIITMQELKGKPSEIKVTPPSGVVHTYHNIDLGRIENSDLAGATIKFRAEKKWIADNGGDRNAVVVMRYHDDWMALETKPIGEDDEYVFFSARTPGFSTFVITMESEEEVTPAEVQTPEHVVEDEVDEPAPVQAESQEGKSYWWLVLVVGAVIAGVIFFCLQEQKR